MSPRDIRSEFRVAVYDHNSAELLRLLGDEPWPRHALQLIGDGLVDALGRGVRAAEKPAAHCAAALRDRGWAGDRVLAEMLEGTLGAGPVPVLRAVPVRLDDVAIALEGFYSIRGGRIDLATGEFWPHTDSGYSEEEDEDEDDEREWLWINGMGSGEGYRDMESFIDDIEDPAIADVLARAIRGRGAFGRFKDALTRWPELRVEWFSFSEDREFGRAREWLADEGCTPVLA